MQQISIKELRTNYAYTYLSYLFLPYTSPQLCAVWVTTPPSPSPFTYINDSSRKFDRLRWKYIGAFIDCMKLCRRRTILDNFIKWCHASSRDLPSFYDVTATEEGETPQNSHSTEKLLLKQSGLIFLAMKYANAAVADIILREVNELNAGNMSDDEWKKQITELLGEGFKCFSRLNCPIDGNIWQSNRIKDQIYNGEIKEVEALCKVFMVLNGIGSNSSTKPSWENKMLLLYSAVKEARRLFPSMALKSISMGQKKKRKRKEAQNNDMNMSTVDEKEGTSKKIVVKVPSDLKEGDTFYAVVACGYFRRNLQLTAPHTKKVMFHLTIPNDAGSEINIMTSKENNHNN